jgi:pimeloyl-ACP methyl ester carboxylesterase
MVSDMHRRPAIIARDSAKLGVHTAGRPSGDAIVLLHSLLADWRAWEQVIGRLATRYFVIAPDMRGHRSSGPSGGAYSISQIGDDVIDVLNELEIPRAHIVGISIGSMIAQQLGGPYQPRSEFDPRGCGAACSAGRFACLGCSDIGSSRPGTRGANRYYAAALADGRRG